MSPRELLDRTSIIDVWAGLGGGDLRHNRGQAFWRDGDGYNVSVNEAKGVWCDHAHGTGGGSLTSSKPCSVATVRPLCDGSPNISEPSLMDSDP